MTKVATVILMAVLLTGFGGACDFNKPKLHRVEIGMTGADAAKAIGRSPDDVYTSVTGTTNYATWYWWDYGSVLLRDDIVYTVNRY